MNRHLPLLLSMVILQSAARGSLVANWSLDGSSPTDGHTGTHAGTVVGTVTFGQTGANAHTGTSAYFGGGGNIDVAYDGILNPASFTLTLWAKVTGGSSYRAAITGRYDQGNNSDGFIIYCLPDNTWSFWTGDGAETATGWLSLSGGAVAMNTWTHLAIVYNAETHTKLFYVNGSPAGSTTTQGYQPNSLRNLHIGGGGDAGTSYRFVGNIDDVSLWNLALSQTAIQHLMQNGVPAQFKPDAVANFDVGTDPAFNGVGPADNASTLFTKVNTVNPTAGAGGISAHVFNGTGFSTPNSPGSELTDDYAYQAGGGDNQGDFMLYGLRPNYTYDIYLAAPDGTAYGDANIYGADYTRTVGSADQTTVRATGGTTEAFTDFVDGRDYAVFTNVRSTPAGDFGGTYNLIAGQPHTGLAGIQVVVVDAPQGGLFAVH